MLRSLAAEDLRVEPSMLRSLAAEDLRVEPSMLRSLAERLVSMKLSSEGPLDFHVGPMPADLMTGSALCLHSVKLDELTKQETFAIRAIRK